MEIKLSMVVTFRNDYSIVSLNRFSAKLNLELCFFFISVYFIYFFFIFKDIRFENSFELFLNDYSMSCLIFLTLKALSKTETETF